MTMQLTKATRKKAKLKIGLAGVSGSGKTYSALKLAKGLCNDWNKVAVIDTENGSADLYAHLGEYNTLTLEAPYSPERYIEAIKSCVEAGMEVLIIDSMSHEWDGRGGILEIADSLTQASASKNSYFVWGKLTPRHNTFVDTILQAPIHVICTMRSKQDYVLNSKDGKQVPQKVGLKAITREGLEYEFTLVFDIDIKHNAVASKDRTELFMDKPEFVISEKTGGVLSTWSNEGISVQVEDKNESGGSVEVRTGIKSYVSTVPGAAKSRQYFALAAQVGYDGEVAKDAVKKQYKLESYNDVEEKQLDAMINAMKKRKEKMQGMDEDLNLDLKEGALDE